MAFKVDDLALLFPRLQARWTEVLVSKFHVAQGTEETPTMIAGDYGLFLGMVKTAGLIIYQNISRLSGLNTTEKGGKYVDFDRLIAGRTPKEIWGVIVPRCNLRVALRTGDPFHALSFDYSRITDVVMEGPFFFVESHHDITNSQDQTAEYLGEESPAGPGIADLLAVWPDDL